MENAFCYKFQYLKNKIYFIFKFLNTNISGIKSNQAIKFGQLIEYNLKNTFLKKLYIKCAGETIPRPFSKK